MSEIDNYMGGAAEEKYQIILDYIKDLSKLKDSFISHHRPIGQEAEEILKQIGESNDQL